MDKKTRTIAIIALAVVILLGLIYTLFGRNRSFENKNYNLTGAVIGVDAKDLSYMVRVNSLIMDYDIKAKSDSLKITDDKQYVKVAISAAKTGYGKPTLDYTNFYLDNNKTSDKEMIPTTAMVDNTFELKSSSNDGDLTFMVDKKWKAEDIDIVIADGTTKEDFKENGRVALVGNNNTEYTANTATTLTGKKTNVKTAISNYDIEITKVTRNYQKTAAAADGKEIIGIEVKITNNDNSSLYVSTASIHLNSNLVKGTSVTPLDAYSSLKEADNRIDSQSVAKGASISGTFYFQTFSGDSKLSLLMDKSPVAID